MQSDASRGHLPPNAFRPCIDLHEGRVKQIVGGSLREDAAPETNYVGDRPASRYAELYRRDGLAGGHVIMLGPGNEDQAREALAAFPGGLQIGGGVHPGNALEWLRAGASHVIVTSYVFRAGQIDWSRLDEMRELVGRERLVLDLSCRKKGERYYVVTDRWQNWTDTEVNTENLTDLADFADEFLVHAADVEGKREGIDFQLVELLAEASPIPATYAGGAREIDDLERVWRRGEGRLALTIGSALDIFGGEIPYRKVVELNDRLRGGSS